MSLDEREKEKEQVVFQSHYYLVVFKYKVQMMGE